MSPKHKVSILKPRTLEHQIAMNFGGGVKMTPQKRALLYIRRKKKFSILLFLLLALLFSACLIGIIMVRALQDTQATLRRTFAGSFYVSTNWPLVGT